MNKNILLGTTLAVLFAISAVAAVSAYHATWQDVTGSVDTVSKNGKTILSVTGLEKIPAHTKDLAGFAFLYGEDSEHTATVLAITTHHGVKDSVQRPNQWHTHNIALDAGSGNAEFCVADIEDAPFAKINVNQNTLSATLDNDDLQSDLSFFASFDIIVEPTCDITKIGGVDNPFGLRLGVDAAP